MTENSPDNVKLCFQYNVNTDQTAVSAWVPAAASKLWHNCKHEESATVVSHMHVLRSGLGRLGAEYPLMTYPHAVVNNWPKLIRWFEIYRQLARIHAHKIISNMLDNLQPKRFTNAGAKWLAENWQDSILDKSAGYITLAGEWNLTQPEE